MCYNTNINKKELIMTHINQALINTINTCQNFIYTSPKKHKFTFIYENNFYHIENDNTRDNQHSIEKMLSWAMNSSKKINFKSVA